MKKKLVSQTVPDIKIAARKLVSPSQKPVTAVPKLGASQHGPRAGREEEHSRHVHRKQVNNTLAIERLEDIATDQRVINTRILVVAQVRQNMLPNVDHFRDSLSWSCPSIVLCIPPQCPRGGESSPKSCTACL